MGAIAAEFNKTRMLVVANATAMSQIIKAEGLAKSKVIIANATREAIDAIAALQSDLDPAQLIDLFLYLDTLRDIAESGKGSFIIPLPP